MKPRATGAVNNMTHEEIVAALRKIERAQQDKMEVWRIVVDPQGHETGQRIYRGSVYRDPQKQAASRGETHES